MQFLVRVVWLASALLPDALGTTDSTPLAPWLVWAAWGVVAIAVLVPHPLSLTVIRFVGPMVVVHGVAKAAMADASWGSLVGLALQSVAVVVGYSSGFGAVHAQAAAYGHERRHLLRPPVAVILPLLLLWLVTAAAGGAAVSADSSIPAATAGGICALLLFFSVRRALVLARRWLVFVPAGIALHDPLVLRDTFMVRSHDVRALRASTANGEAFDATCTTWGDSLELVLSHPHDVSLSNFGARVSGTLDRLHVTALRVSPSRPQDALADQRAVPPPSTTRSSES